MKPSTFLACALALATPATWALSVDAKALARYDGSYVVCEATFPEMRGHRDEAYLSLWRAKADAANRAQLADVRKGAVYRARARAPRADEREGIGTGGVQPDQAGVPGAVGRGPANAQRRQTLDDDAAQR